MAQINRNRSFFFLMPLLNIPANYPKEAGIVNTYVKHSKFPDITGRLFVLCDSLILNEAKQARYKLLNHPKYERSYVYDDYELLVFKFKDAHAEAFKLFLEGKYSKLSVEVKDIILKMFLAVVDGKPSKNFAVLYPNDPNALTFKRELEERIGMELGPEAEIISAPDMEKETFKLSDHFHLYDTSDGHTPLNLK